MYYERGRLVCRYCAVYIQASFEWTSTGIESRKNNWKSKAKYGETGNMVKTYRIA
jgi:hypothetical protein